MFVIRLYQAQRRQEMGRLSEDIMAMFGVKPSDQQRSVEDHTVSSARVGMSTIYLLLYEHNTCCMVHTVLTTQL